LSLILTQVDGVYFKVHRDLLARASGAIKDMLAIPVGQDPSQVEGTTVDNAIMIPEVPCQHFLAILQAVYERCVVVILEWTSRVYNQHAALYLQMYNRGFTGPAVLLTFNGFATQPRTL